MDYGEMIVPRSFSYVKSRRVVMPKETEKAVRVATMNKLEKYVYMCMCDIILLFLLY